MKDKIFSPFSEAALIPKEERIETIHKKEFFSIGIPKEEYIDEKRVCLTPDAVSVLVANGHQVTIESGAGLGANFTDKEYSDAGAKIVYSKKEVLSQKIILKVEPPTQDELDIIPPETILFSAVQINNQKTKYFESLQAKRIMAFGFEFIRDRHGEFTLIRMISEIAGYAAILYAAELMSNTNGGSGLILAGITGLRSSEVVFLGAGTVTEVAARVALGLGCSVRIFDNSLSKLRRIKHEVGNVSTSVIDPKELSKSLMRADVVIAAVNIEGKVPIWVTERMVQTMKPGSVIIDLSIDQGACIETSELTTLSHPTVVKYDVIHCGIPNITSRVARSSSKVLSNFFLSYLLEFAERGGFKDNLNLEPHYYSGVYMFKGKCTNKNISDRFSLHFHDLSLLII